jgi:NAD(P)-dependent dehydrogenase (short-subunit alcohol dehydrogenase family)
MSSAPEGKRVVITGITGGIARATTELLSAQGAEVVVSARSEQKLEQAMSEIPGKITGYVMDLLEPKSVERFFESVGEFDHLVTPAASATFAPIAELDIDGARELMESKQWGQLLCVKSALPYLNKQGSIAVFSGTVSHKPIAGATAYAAVGAASEAMARIWALELAPIRVNAIVPGVIETDIWANLMGSEQAAQDQLNAIASVLPVGRVGTVQDVAKAVVFALDNGFVNGASIVVDGGHRVI